MFHEPLQSSQDAANRWYNCIAEIGIYVSSFHSRWNSTRQLTSWCVHTVLTCYYITLRRLKCVRRNVLSLLNQSINVEFCVAPYRTRAKAINRNNYSLVAANAETIQYGMCAKEVNIILKKQEKK